MITGKTYSELLKDPRWQKRRLEIFQKDRWTCTRCPNGLDDGKEFHAHHLHYLPNCPPWLYPDDAIVTLCEDCHAKAHGKPVKLEHDIVVIGRRIGDSIRGLRGFTERERLNG